MTSEFSVPDRSILVDEVGIRMATHGDLRLKTAFQPVLAVHPRTLALEGLRAFVQPHRLGVKVPPVNFFAGVPACGRAALDLLLIRLHLENRLNAGVADPEAPLLWLGIDPSRGIEDAAMQIDTAKTYAADATMQIVCEITRTEILSRDRLSALVARIRGHGMRIATDAIGVAVDEFDGIAVDFVKLRGQLFRDLSRVRKAASLIRPLVEASRHSGAKVLIEGIETRSQLAVALDSGATHVQGFLFGLPQPAGTIVEEGPHAIARLLAGTWDAVSQAS